MSTRVTYADTCTGETESAMIEDACIVITDGLVYLAEVQHYPESGAAVFTIRRRAGEQ